MSKLDFFKWNSLVRSSDILDEFSVVTANLAHQGMLRAVALAIKDNQLPVLSKPVNHRSIHLIVGKD
ncbi:hypothetical protein NYE24_15795 [Paenibacillus sp. FSL H7-0350]|uniref:hypothetical protein n=1 Tax=Paenibacillus sp. FSL H7-0350 TaxID=2975345 RepID=UPI003157F3AB